MSRRLRPLSLFAGRLRRALILALCMLLPHAALADTPSKAPEFTGISQWLNSEPLTMQSLRGKVVLIDFWAYSCINCLRTLPHVTAWYDKYKDDGLVVVGIHAPEFAFGKDPANVRRAIKKFAIHYPVAMDNGMATWRAWDNHYWPSKYLVDRKGKIIMHHVGEGHYQETENAIRDALGLGPMTSTVPDKDFSGIGSPEMYFGANRVSNLANGHLFARISREYQLPGKLAFNHFALAGNWKLSDNFAELTGNEGTIRLRYRATAVHMVAEASGQPVTLTVVVDGEKKNRITVTGSRLYTLYRAEQSGKHSIDIHIEGRGFRAYTFTFG